MTIQESIGAIAELKQRAETLRAMGAAGQEDARHVIEGIDAVVGGEVRGVASEAQGAMGDVLRSLEDVVQKAGYAMDQLEMWMGILSEAAGG